MLRICLAIAFFLLTSCSYSIAEIDVSNYERSCVRQCSTSYSSCVSGGNQVGFKTETLRACKESYVVCVHTCPAQ